MQLQSAEREAGLNLGACKKNLEKFTCAKQGEGIPVGNSPSEGKGVCCAKCRGSAVWAGDDSKIQTEGSTSSSKAS